MASGQDLPEPLAQGDLARTPFAHVLLYIQNNWLSGTLVVWDPSAGERPTQERIRLQRGVPIAGRLSQQTSRLDRGLLQIFARKAGPYAFYEDVDLVGSSAEVKQGRVNVPALIAASLRGSSRDDAVEHILNGLGGSKLRLTHGLDTSSFGLLPEELELLELLRAEPSTLDALIEMSALEPRAVRRLTYLLVITKSAEPWDAPPRQTDPPPEKGAHRRKRTSKPVFEPALPSNRPAPSGPGARTSSPDHDAVMHEIKKRSGTHNTIPKTADTPETPPEHLADNHKALWNDIKTRLVAIDDQNFYQMLDVARDAPAEAIQTAYYGQVKKWHPDRIPPELSELRGEVEQIFRHLTRAQETLSDGETRKKYLQEVQDGGGTPESERKLVGIVSAAMEYRKVEILLRRREWDDALALIDVILEVNTDQAEYHATRGWILYQKSGGDPGTRAEVMSSIDRALQLAEDYDKAHYYKGVVQKRHGNARDALVHFRRAAELNPRNIEAVREVRISEMRGGGPQASKSKGKAKGDSLFGKLFGGGKKK